MSLPNIFRKARRQKGFPKVDAVIHSDTLHTEGFKPSDLPDMSFGDLLSHFWDVMWIEIEHATAHTTDSDGLFFTEFGFLVRLIRNDAGEITQMGVNMLDYDADHLEVFDALDAIDWENDEDPIKRNQWAGAYKIFHTLAWIYCQAHMAPEDRQPEVKSKMDFQTGITTKTKAPVIREKSGDSWAVVSTDTMARRMQPVAHASVHGPGHAKRDHAVRGHWRRYKKSGKLVYVKAHRRGDAELGTVTKLVTT